MAQMKNLHLLEPILSEQDLIKIEHAATEHLRYNNISFKINELEEKKVTIQVSQGKNSAGAYHDQKRLIEIVHETYDRFFEGYKVFVHAIPYVESPASDVDAAWINQQMLLQSIKIKDIAKDTGIDYSQLRSVVTEANPRPLSQPMKALFYYYFIAKKAMLSAR